MAGKLFIIPTLLSPDTHAATLPPLISEVIRNTTHYLVENERTARRFISSLKTGITIDLLQFTILDKDTAADTIMPVLEKMKTGINIGIISEAGCPGIADPGALAISLAHIVGIEVVPLTGPSSILLALMGSGMNGQSFHFAGYLPIEKPERIKSIKLLEKESEKYNRTQIFIETPYRNNVLLADLLENCHPHTKCCLASDLTAPEQMIVTKKIQDWKKTVPNLHKKPTVFLLYAG